MITTQRNTEKYFEYVKECISSNLMPLSIENWLAKIKQDAIVNTFEIHLTCNHKGLPTHILRKVEANNITEARRIAEDWLIGYELRLNTETGKGGYVPTTREQKINLENKFKSEVNRINKKIAAEKKKEEETRKKFLAEIAAMGLPVTQ